MPSDLIDVHSDVSFAGMGSGYYLPSSTSRGHRRFEFSPDTSPVAALDAIVASVGMPSGVVPNKPLPGDGGVKTRRGLRWGVNASGSVFLEPAYEHQPGRYQWTIDDDTAVVEDWVASLRSARGLSDFTNLLHVMAGEGVDATVRNFSDSNSWNNTTAERFIGDIWEKFMSFPDGADINAIGEQLWEELSYMHWLISFRMDHQPWIVPDNEIRVMGLSNMDIPDQSIFRVIRKNWALTNMAEGSGRYTQTVDAVMVQEGPT